MHQLTCTVPSVDVSLACHVQHKPLKPEDGQLSKLSHCVIVELVVGGSQVMVQYIQVHARKYLLPSA
jgi:hypothetical protein